MFQDLDAVASGDGDVVTLKRAITIGDIETVTQLLDKGVYRQVWQSLSVGNILFSGLKFGHWIDYFLTQMHQ